MKKRIFAMLLSGALVLPSPLLASAQANVNWSKEFKRADQITQQKRTTKKLFGKSSSYLLLLPIHL